MGRAIEISAFRRDAIVKVYRGPGRKGGGKRGAVSGLSDQSRGRLLFTAFNSSCDWLAFAVLTYPSEFPMDGGKVKRDVHTLMKRMWYEFEAKVVWGLEFQERGAPHINLLVDRFIPKDWLSLAWFEVVGSGDLRHLAAGTRIEFAGGTKNVAGYMAAAYSAKKSKQKEVPEGFENVGRFWGSSRGLVKVEAQGIFLENGESVAKVRSLRKYTELGVKPRRCQPMRDEGQRKRKVKRKPKLRHLHAGLSGFRSFKGSPVAKRLLGVPLPSEELGGRSECPAGGSEQSG